MFGRYWIEDESTGCFYREFGGDPGYAQNVCAYYTSSDGYPIMLEPADPPSRAELEDPPTGLEELRGKLLRERRP